MVLILFFYYTRKTGPGQQASGGKTKPAAFFPPRGQALAGEKKKTQNMRFNPLHSPEKMVE